MGRFSFVFLMVFLGRLLWGSPIQIPVLWELTLCWLVSAHSFPCFAHPKIHNLLLLFVFPQNLSHFENPQILSLLVLPQSFLACSCKNKILAWLFLPKSSFCLFFRKIYLIVEIHKSFLLFVLTQSSSCLFFHKSSPCLFFHKIYLIFRNPQILLLPPLFSCWFFHKIYHILGIHKSFFFHHCFLVCSFTKSVTF